MEAEEFERHLQASAHFRQSLADLFQAVEQALALVAAAAARQLDAGRFETALLELQSRAAAQAPDAARDHLLNEVRRLLKAARQA